jgi:hypothetical protein
MPSSEEQEEETHALPRRYYGDPLECLIQSEASTCKGCVHERTTFDRRYCDKGRKHGRRCGSYVELRFASKR